MRRLAIGMALSLSAAPLLPASADPAPQDPPGPDAAALNRRIADENAAILKSNADRAAAWERATANVAAENARRQADYAAKLAAHEAAMKHWQATTAARDTIQSAPAGASGDAKPKSQQMAARPQPAAGQPKRVCHMETVTGSLTKRIRVCSTPRERNEASDNVRANWGQATSSGCGSPSCP